MIFEMETPESKNTVVKAGSQAILIVTVVIAATKWIIKINLCIRYELKRHSEKLDFSLQKGLSPLK